MKLLVLVIAVMTLGACSAIHNMIDMPNKMDNMNAKMDKMTQGMDKTVSKMDETNAGMNQTVVGINDQRVFLPVKELMDEKNYESLSPIPSQLMPFGKKLGEAISVNDLAELFYLWQKEIREVKPVKQMDKDGNEVEYTVAEVNRINRNKLGRLLALQSIAGFLPDEKVTALVETHIKKHSRYENTAYEILMMRAVFIRDVLLKESLLSQPLETVGQVSQSAVYTTQLDYIARLRFADKIQYKTSGFLAPYPNEVGEKLDKKMMLPLLEKIKLSVSQDFKMETQNFVVSYSDEENSQEQKLQVDLFNQAIGKLDAQLEYWKANTPQ